MCVHAGAAGASYALLGQGACQGPLDLGRPTLSAYYYKILAFTKLVDCQAVCTGLAACIAFDFETRVASAFLSEVQCTVYGNNLPAKADIQPGHVLDEWYFFSGLPQNNPASKITSVSANSPLKDCYVKTLDKQQPGQSTRRTTIHILMPVLQMSVL